jgi:acetylornithine deacetylase/succinyl-diaminopimelate desuccinylase family protein
VTSITRVCSAAATVVRSYAVETAKPKESAKSVATLRRDDPANQVVAAIDDDQTLDLLRHLIGVPSGNPPGNEGAVATVLAAALGREGVEARLEDVSPGRPNLAADLGPAGGPTLLLNGHTDTMPPGLGWTTDPYGATVRDGKVYGLGACDMKAGLAAMSEAFLAMKRSGIRLRGRVYLDAVVDEEAGGAGTKQTVAEGRRADFAIIAEPTGLDVLRLGNGQVNFQVSFHGLAGHGSIPEAGHNAIYDAAAFASVVEAENARLAERPHPLIGPASYSVGRIDGGVRTSIIPAECLVGVDRRILPGQSVPEAIADLDDLLERVRAGRRGMRADRTVEVEYEPFEVPEDLSGCQALRDAASEVTGREVSFGGLRATTDAVFLTNGGTPTVVFGPGSLEQAHRPDEYVSIEQLNLATRALALTAVRLLA